MLERLSDDNLPICSFGIMLAELVRQKEPFADYHLTPVQVNGRCCSFGTVSEKTISKHS